MYTEKNNTDESKFRNMIREMLSTEEQTRGYANITGGNTNDLYNIYCKALLNASA